MLPDGRVVWVTTGRGSDEQTGTITHTKGVGLDITDRKEAELEILRLNKRWSRVRGARRSWRRPTGARVFQLLGVHDLALRSMTASARPMEKKTLPTGSLDNLAGCLVQQMSRLIGGCWAGAIDT